MYSLHLIILLYDCINLALPCEFNVRIKMFCIFFIWDIITDECIITRNSEYYKSLSFFSLCFSLYINMYKFFVKSFSLLYSFVFLACIWETACVPVRGLPSSWANCHLQISGLREDLSTVAFYGHSTTRVYWCFWDPGKWDLRPSG